MCRLHASRSCRCQCSDASTARTLRCNGIEGRRHDKADGVRVKDCGVPSSYLRFVFSYRNVWENILLLLQLVWIYRQVSYLNNTARYNAERLCDHCYRGKETSITYSECVCSISYPACKAHAPYCRLWPVRLYQIFPHCLINGTIFGEKSYYYLACCTTFLHLPAPIWQLYYILPPVVSVIPVFFH